MLDFRLAGTSFSMATIRKTSRERSRNHRNPWWRGSNRKCRYAANGARKTGRSQKGALTALARDRPPMRIAAENVESASQVTIGLRVFICRI